MTSTLFACETDEPMTPEQLQATARTLGKLNRESLKDAYRRAHHGCRLDAGTIPDVDALQELIIAWRLMQAWYERTELASRPE